MKKKKLKYDKLNKYWKGLKLLTQTLIHHEIRNVVGRGPDQNRTLF